jgi:dihydroneopterin aldolase
VSDRIILSEMVFFAAHGVLPEERAGGQIFVVDLEVEADIHRAGHTDDLADTLDYRDLYARVQGVMTGGPVNLLEALAEGVAHRVLEVERVTGVRVRVRKPHVRLGGPLAYAAVEVERRRR